MLVFFRGRSSNKKYGLQFSNSIQQQQKSSSTGNSNHFLAVLDCDIIMYEIVLDHSAPADLSKPFLKDFFQVCRYLL